MIRRTAFGLLLTVSVSSLASAQNLRASVPNVTTQAPSVATWQAQHDAAVSKKARGQRNMLIGGGVAVIGVLLSATSGGCDMESISAISDCSSGATTGTVGLLASLAGLGVVGHGAYTYFGARADLIRLEAQRPTGRGTAILTFNDRQSIAIRAGKERSVSYRVTW